MYHKLLDQIAQNVKRNSLGQKIKKIASKIKAQQVQIIAIFLKFFFKPLFTRKEKFNLQNMQQYSSGFYRIPAGKKQKTLKENIVILKQM